MEDSKPTNKCTILRDSTNLPIPNESPLHPDKRRKFMKSTIFDYWASLEADPYPVGPMGRLLTAMKSNAQVIVMTRGMREIKALLTGKLVAFDRYWNLILDDVTEYCIHLDKSALKSSSGPGRKIRKKRRRIRKCLEKTELQKMQQASISTTCLPVITNNMDDALWDLSISPTEDVGSIYRDDCCYTLDDFPMSPCQPSTSDAACMADCPIGNEASERGSMWTASPVQMSLSTSKPSKDTSDHRLSSWSRVFHEQLFIRGANIVTVRVVKDSLSSQD